MKGREEMAALILGSVPVSLREREREREREHMMVIARETGCLLLQVCTPHVASVGLMLQV